MDHENNNSSQLLATEEPDSVSDVAESILERGAGVYGKAREAVSHAYDNTAGKLSKTCEKAKEYSVAHPGKAVLIALGIGLGVGLLLGARSHHSRTRRIAQPMVHALSDMALAFFR